MKMLKLIVIILFIMGLIGEIKCVVKFIDSDFEASYRREMIYGFASITGAGVVVGWLDYPDTPPKQK